MWFYTVLLQFFFIIFAKNLFFINIVSSMWLAISWRVYLSHIIHQWPFSRSVVFLPHPELCFGRIQSLCFYFSQSASSGRYGWSFPLDVERAEYLDSKNKRQSVVFYLASLYSIICISLHSYVTPACLLLLLLLFLVLVSFSPHSLHTFLPKSLSNWHIYTIHQGRLCSILKTPTKAGCTCFWFLHQEHGTGGKTRMYQEINQYY